jgi:SAM-dependent methyltransferase
MSVCLDQSSSREYWNAAAETYESEFTSTVIGRLWRDAVWRDLDRTFIPGQRLLELNCGSGIDAEHLAARGVRVLGCDISPRMVELARERASSSGFSALLDFRVLPTEQIDELDREGAFDGAFSNFSGLNCVQDLPAVAAQLAKLLRPGATLLICMLGRFAAWDMAWNLVHGHWGNPMQRLRGHARSSDNVVSVRYPSPRKIAKAFSPGFEIKNWKGIGITIPPAYMERRVRQFPRVTRHLAGLDRRLARTSPFRNLASCVLLEFERSGMAGGR